MSAQSPVLVFLGDSITEGYRLPPGAGFPEHIAARLRATGKDYRVINAGQAGDTSVDALARLRALLHREARLHWLVLELGFNDELNGLGLDTTRATLRAIIRETRAHSPDARVAIFQIVSLHTRGPRYARDFAALFPEIAESEKITLLPFLLEDVVGRPELNQADGLHPNARGMRIVAESVWRQLGPLL